MNAGFTVNGKNLTSNLANYNIDLIIIGGDVAYDDGMNTCYYSWDTFFSMFDDLTRQKNRLIPIMTSVGNHDVRPPRLSLFLSLSLAQPIRSPSHADWS